MKEKEIVVREPVQVADGHRLTEYIPPRKFLTWLIIIENESETGYDMRVAFRSDTKRVETMEWGVDLSAQEVLEKIKPRGEVRLVARANTLAALMTPSDVTIGVRIADATRLYPVDDGGNPTDSVEFTSTYRTY